MSEETAIIDYVALQHEFKKHCCDYMEDISLNKPSRAIEFCSKVIYEIDPESRKVKKGTPDKLWKMKFEKGDDTHVVFIATFKNTTHSPEYKDKYMILTVSQAVLLAMDTFARLVPLLYDERGAILMTPLAGACFSKNDIIQISKDLNVPVKEMNTIINQSCQNNSHYLPYGNVNVAAVASFVANRNIKDVNLRSSIVNKVIHQYISKGQMPQTTTMQLITKNAIGFALLEFSFEKLLAIYNSAKQ